MGLGFPHEYHGQLRLSMGCPAGQTRPFLSKLGVGKPKLQPGYLGFRL